MTFAQAIERRSWEAAALLLLLGVSRVLMRLPEAGIDDLLAALEAGDE